MRLGLCLYEPIEFPVDTLEIWAPTIDGDQGYLEPDDAHLDASAGHVAENVVYMNRLLA